MQLEHELEVHLSGYRQPGVSSALKHHMTRQSYTKERKEMMIAVWERVKYSGLLFLPPLGFVYFPGPVGS